MKPLDLGSSIEDAKQERLHARREMGRALAQKSLAQLLGTSPETWARLGEDGLKEFLENFGSRAQFTEAPTATPDSVPAVQMGWRQRHANLLIKAADLVNLMPYPLRGLICGLLVGLFTMAAGIAIAHAS